MPTALSIALLIAVALIIFSFGFCAGAFAVTLFFDEERDL